jgi:hypothetical protein
MAEKRKIPRHVDGRIKIGPFPLKWNFVKFFPIALLIIIIVFRNVNEISVLIGMISLSITGLLFVELKNKETGLTFIKEWIEYSKNGDVYYERSCLDVPSHKRIIWNKKVQEIRRREAKRKHTN